MGRRLVVGVVGVIVDSRANPMADFKQ
jgi:hypothetical protein